MLIAYIIGTATENGGFVEAMKNMRRKSFYIGREVLYIMSQKTSIDIDIEILRGILSKAFFHQFLWDYFNTLNPQRKCV